MFFICCFSTTIGQRWRSVSQNSPDLQKTWQIQMPVVAIGAVPPGTNMKKVKKGAALKFFQEIQGVAGKKVGFFFKSR
jgi:hypothetical protein